MQKTKQKKKQSTHEEELFLSYSCWSLLDNYICTGLKELTEKYTQHGLQTKTCNKLHTETDRHAVIIRLPFNVAVGQAFNIFESPIHHYASIYIHVNSYCLYC